MAAIVINSLQNETYFFPSRATGLGFGHVTFLIIMCTLDISPLWAQSIVASKNISELKVLEKASTPRRISLNQAVALGLKENFDIKIAINRVKQRQAQRMASRAKILPKIKGSLRYTRNIPEIKTNLSRSDPSQTLLYNSVAKLLDASGDPADSASAAALRNSSALQQRRPSSGNLVTKPKHGVDGTLSLEIPIFNGPNFAQLFSANDHVKLEKARLMDQRNQSIYFIARAYFEALHYAEIFELRKLQKEVEETRHQKINDQLKRGLLNKSDRLNSEYNFQQVNQTLENAQLNFDLALGDLGFLIGAKENFSLEEPKRIEFEGLDQSDNILASLAVNNRADVKAQDQAIRVASRERLSGVLRFLPVISFQADANYTSNTSGLVGEALTYALMLNVSYNFFDGGSKLAALKESALKKQAELLTKQDMVEKIEAQIRGRKKNIALLKKLKETRKSRIEFTAENLKLQSDRYRQGLIELDDLLETQKEHFDAQIFLKKTESDIILEQLAFSYDIGALSPFFAETF